MKIQSPLVKEIFFDSLENSLKYDPETGGISAGEDTGASYKTLLLKNTNQSATLGATGTPGGTVSFVDVKADGVLSDSFVLGSWSEDVPVTLAAERKVKSNKSTATQRPGIYPVGLTGPGGTQSGTLVGGDFTFTNSIIFDPLLEDPTIQALCEPPLIRCTKIINGEPTIRCCRKALPGGGVEAKAPGIYPTGLTGPGSTQSGVEIGGLFALANSFWGSSLVLPSPGGPLDPGGPINIPACVVCRDNEYCSTNGSGTVGFGGGIVLASCCLRCRPRTTPVNGVHRRGVIPSYGDGGPGVPPPGVYPMGLSGPGLSHSGTYLGGEIISGNSFLAGSFIIDDSNRYPLIMGTGSTASGASFSGIQIVGDVLVTPKVEITKPKTNQPQMVMNSNTFGDTSNFKDGSIWFDGTDVYMMISGKKMKFTMTGT
jgi:hypothetical protein